MTILRWIITLILVMYVSAFPIEGLINAQFSLADINDGTVEGQYDVTFEIYSSTENMNEEDPLWT